MEEWRGVRFLQSESTWCAMSSAAVGSLSLSKSANLFNDPLIYWDASLHFCEDLEADSRRKTLLSQFHLPWRPLNNEQEVNCQTDKLDSHCMPEQKKFLSLPNFSLQKLPTQKASFTLCSEFSLETAVSCLGAPNAKLHLGSFINSKRC